MEVVNEHALFDLVSYDGNSNYDVNQTASVGFDNANDDNYNDINEDDNFNDSQMNDNFAYSSSSQSHYSNSTSSLQSNVVRSKCGNVPNGNVANASTSFYAITDVPSSISNNNKFILENQSSFHAYRPLIIDEHKQSRLVHSPHRSTRPRTNAMINIEKNVNMYKKLNEIWHKCTKVASELVKRRSWTSKQRKTLKKSYVRSYVFDSSGQNRNRNKENSLSTKQNIRWQTGQEVSSEQCSPWNLPIVDDALIHQLRSIVTLQIGQNADSALHKSVQMVQTAFLRESSSLSSSSSSSLTTLPRSMWAIKEVRTKPNKIDESTSIQLIRSAKLVSADNRRKGNSNNFRLRRKGEETAHVTYKRVRRENNGDSDAETRLAKELMHLATLLHRSLVHAQRQQGSKCVETESKELQRASDTNCKDILLERNELNITSNYTENDECYQYDENNVTPFFMPKHSSTTPFVFNETQHKLSSEHYNNNKSNYNSDKRTSYDTSLYYSQPNCNTMHNEAFSDVRLNDGKYKIGDIKNGKSLTTAKEQNENYKLPSLHNTEQQNTREICTQTELECNNQKLENIVPIVKNEHQLEREQAQDEQDNDTNNKNFQHTAAPLLNLVYNDNDVSVRKVYDTLLNEFLERTVSERVGRTLANLNDAAERGLSESILRQVLTHFTTSGNNEKQSIEQEKSADKTLLQGELKINNTSCISNVPANSMLSISVGNKNYTRVLNSVRFTGVVQHIRAGKPMMLHMLEFDKEDEEILNRVASFRTNNHDIAVSLNTPGYSITYAQLASLCASCWLSDQVINNYLQLLCEEFCTNEACETNRPATSTIASLGTHFYAKVQTELNSLTGGNYDYTYDADKQSFCWNLPPLPEKSAVLRWLRRRSELLRSYKPIHREDKNNTADEIGDKTEEYKSKQSIPKVKTSTKELVPVVNTTMQENDNSTCVRVVFIPVNIHDQHWALVVWNKETEQLIYYDSLGRHSGYYRARCLVHNNNITSGGYHTNFMQNTRRVTPTRAERILAELDHVLSECQRHLLNTTNARKTETVIDNFIQSNNNFRSVMNSNCSDVRCVVGRNESINNTNIVVPMTIDKCNSVPCRKLGVQHVIADSYTASLHALSDYKPFRSLLDLQVAQDEFAAKVRMSSVDGKSTRSHIDMDTCTTSWTMTSDEGNNDITDIEIEWFAQGHLKVPRQSNGNDCGVFVCQVAWCVAHGVAVNFTQEDIYILRKVMILELWCKRVLRRLLSRITSSSCDVNLSTL